MPARRPSATFVPLPTNFNLNTLVEQTASFEWVHRVSYGAILQEGPDALNKLVLRHVVIGGLPLIIEGFQEILDPSLFSASWLRSNHGDKIETARDLSSRKDLHLTVGHYLANMTKLCDQFTSGSPTSNGDHQRVYLKDVDCPPAWKEELKAHIPPGLFYQEDSVYETGGIHQFGDLMGNLPASMQADNLMAYIGHEGTYTPAHIEMCASLGQNIMVECSKDVDSDGNPTRPGYSIWFMTETEDRHLVSEYWLSVLGHDIGVENHFAQVAAWRQAPFKTYVVEQRAGDFILIPPLAAHQVWNSGTRTMKVAWNRTTVETLEMAIGEALPNARMICREEQYNTKAIVYYTLLKSSEILALFDSQLPATAPSHCHPSQSKLKQLRLDFRRLFLAYKRIIMSEMFGPGTSEHTDHHPFDGYVTCAFCRCNIFNRFLTCPNCVNDLDEETSEAYDLCLDCFVMGRSCQCVSNFKWVEQFDWRHLIRKYEEWRHQILQMDGWDGATAPLSLDREREKYARKTTAQICQEQLEARPWCNPNQPLPESDDEFDDFDTDDDDYHGIGRSVRRKRSATWLKKHPRCHACTNRLPAWKMACCTKCNKWYCYGVLYRAFDLLPNEILQDPRWECPHCKGICSASACRKDARQTPYEPRGTRLGHDTRDYADPRSIQSLIDFNKSNLAWLRDEPDTPSKRLAKRLEEAQIAKQSPSSLGEGHYASEDDLGPVFAADVDHLTFDEFMDSSIDPALGGAGVAIDHKDPMLADYQHKSGSDVPAPDTATELPISSLDEASSVSWPFDSTPEYGTGMQPSSYQYPNPSPYSNGSSDGWPPYIPVSAPVYSHETRPLPSHTGSVESFDPLAGNSRESSLAAQRPSNASESVIEEA